MTAKQVQRWARNSYKGKMTGAKVAKIAKGVLWKNSETKRDHQAQDFTQLSSLGANNKFNIIMPPQDDTAGGRNGALIKISTSYLKYALKMNRNSTRGFIVRVIGYYARQGTAETDLTLTNIMSNPNYSRYHVGYDKMHKFTASPTA